MKKSQKIILLTVGSFLLLSSLAALILAAGFIYSARIQVALPDPVLKLVPEKGITQAGDVRAELDITLPLCRSVENVQVTPPEGTVLSGSAAVSWSALRFSTRKWKIRILLRPLHAGQRPPGRLTFDVTRPGEDPQNFTAKIPGFDVQSAPEAPKLELAGAVDAIRTHRISPWYWLLLLLLPAGIFLAWFLRRPARPKELTEWEKAFNELKSLREKIDARELPPEQAFITLTELMRRYLERRFGLPVTRRTAQEFTSLMDQYGKTFPASSRPFLREFLNEADLVKFAKAVPDGEQVERSAESAAQFIGHTRPESEVQNV